MTKTEATKLARRARSHGYYRTSSTECYVFCPRCGERVAAEHVPWEHSLPKILDPFIIEHLLYACAQ